MQEYGKVSFDCDWKFLKSDGPDFDQESFDDSAWRRLSVPHDWSIEGPYQKENPSQKAGGFLPTGIGWYRKEFSADLSGHIFFQFDGIYCNSTIWINGQKVIFHPYGFTSFRFEATKYLHSGKNVIAIQVDDHNSPSSRWYNGCGIYRHTWMIHKPESYLLPDSFVYTKNLEKAKAVLALSFASTGGSQVELDILDNKKESIVKKTVLVDTKETEITITDPILWDLSMPYLYELKLSLLNQDHAVIDQQKILFGIRDVKLDAAKGLFFNGRSLKLQGVCLHHDAGGLGASVPESILKKRLLLLKEGGFNAIRTGHTPFAPEFYELCDQIGLLVMDEMFDGWHKKALGDYGGTHFLERGKQDLIEFIRRDRNHPCVILWGIGNETGDTDQYGLTEICHQEDPTRFVSGGQLLYGVDVIGLNGPSETPGYLEKLHLTESDRPVLLAEYPHCYSTRGFYKTMTWWRDYNRPRFELPNYSEKELFHDFQPAFSKVVCYNSSYDNATCRISHKEALQRAMTFEHVIGMFLWTGFDYLGESFGWPYRSNNCGIIDLAGFPKDIYYFYQSQWTTKPMIHMLPGWDLNIAKDTLVPIIIYTNCDEVTLYLNGVSLGTRKRANALELRFDVPYQEGCLKAVGVYNDGTVVHTESYTSKTMTRLDLSCEDSLETMKDSTTQVVLRVLDEDNHPCNNADCRVSFYTSEQVQLLGLENGDPFDLQCNKDTSRKLFYGLLKAYLKVTKPFDSLIFMAASVLGKTYFTDSTLCTISVESLLVDGFSKTDCMKITYTTDGSNPMHGIVYEHPFVLCESCTVKAVAQWGDHQFFFEQDFVKGTKESIVVTMEQPREKALVGIWECNEDRLQFFANGNADIYKDGEKVREVSWWYESPIDKFESDTGDIDCGELIFPFENHQLKLMDAMTLRKRKTGESESKTQYYKKVE